MKSWKIAATLALLVLAASCSANPRISEPAQRLPEFPAAVSIDSLDQESSEEATRITLHGNFPFSYTSYEPDYTTLVLELLDVDASAIAGITPVDSDALDSLEAMVLDDGLENGVVSQVTFHLNRPAIHELRTKGNDLILEFRADPAHPAAMEETPSAVLPVENAMAPPSLPELGAVPALSDRETLMPASLEGVDPASALLNVSSNGENASPVVYLQTDGKVDFTVFELEDPDRVVIDLNGLINRVPAEQRTLELDSALLERIRVAQFTTSPEMVARVVLDLSAPHAYEVRALEDGLSVEFPTLMAHSAPREEPVQSPSEPLPADTALEPVPEALAETPSVNADGTAEMNPSSSQLETNERVASARESLPPTPAEESSKEVPVESERMESEPEQLPVNLAAETPLAGSPESGLTLVEASNEPPPAIPMDQEQEEMVESGSELVPLHPVTATKPKGPMGNNITVPVERFSARTISDHTKTYTGKRISLNFKDADLKDVFRIFHEISGYNVVLDPSVGGSVTIVLENVPSDQALDIILKNNGLDKIFEDNVIRIASTQKLAQEASARKQLQEAKELEEQPATFTRSLSYAKAKDVVPIIKRMMSKRGDVVMDERTNTLIISDINAKREPINRLIDTLDEQTPQVSIEARIVETDREFERNLGIAWGVAADFDPELGTQTGLQFPHRANLAYDVNLASPNAAGSLGISFGNVLDSFTLDARLDAFELNGDVKILSAPKIATQNNKTAIIEQGVQIPVVNTTATEINVEFISASLRLEVTPQITKEGTVIMVVKVDNSSPDFVNRVGDVPPIITERAETQILVEDGGTAVIGGIFKVDDSVSETGVPGLKNIPGLGWLFKSKTVRRKNTELLIFITPRILAKA